MFLNILFIWNVIINLIHTPLEQKGKDTFIDSASPLDECITSLPEVPSQAVNSKVASDIASFNPHIPSDASFDLLFREYLSLASGGKSRLGLIIVWSGRSKLTFLVATPSFPALLLRWLRYSEFFLAFFILFEPPQFFRFCIYIIGSIVNSKLIEYIITVYSTIILNDIPFSKMKPQIKRSKIRCSLLGVYNYMPMC